MKSVVLGIRLNSKQSKYIYDCAKKDGFVSTAEYIRALLLKDMPKEYKPTKRDFRYTRMQNRIFRCGQELWDQIMNESENNSHFIRQSIREKLEREKE